MRNSMVSPINDAVVDIDEPLVKAYWIIKTGSVDALRDLRRLRNLDPNALLHVAAQHGKEEMVKYIVADIFENRSLAPTGNRRGDTALHVAAKAGHLATVKALCKIFKKHDLLQARNENGNTALHEALLFNFKDDSIAKFLIEEAPELLFIKNNKHESAMYLAVKAGFESCISMAPRQTSHHQQSLDELFKNNPHIIMEAIKKKDDTGVLEALIGLGINSNQFRDGERNPLHSAASLGYYKTAEYLLGIRGDYATKKDEYGSLPIHLASIEGHVKVVELLLKDNIIDPEELLDKKGRGILHLAAENGRDNVVRFLLNETNLEYHTNMEDEDGNTALHLATKNWKAMAVKILTWNNRVCIDAVNNQGYTPLDVAETSKQSDYTNTKWLTINALRTAGATRRSHDPVTPEIEEEAARIKEIYKEKVNYRLLIAILIATVAFEAGFRSPYEKSSYLQSKSNSSLENMMRPKAFTVYVFSNTIAMYSSVAGAVVLSWAQSGDLTLVITALNLTLPLFWLALSMISMAFTAGVYLVMDNHCWLRIASLAMGVSFHMFLLFNSLVLFSPIDSSNKYLRYLCDYPFRFLVFMNSGGLSHTSRLRYFVWSTQH